MKHRKGSGVDFTNLVFYFWQILKKTARSRVPVLLEYRVSRVLIVGAPLIFSCIRLMSSPM